MCRPQRNLNVRPLVIFNVLSQSVHSQSQDWGDNVDPRLQQ